MATVHSELTGPGERSVPIVEPCDGPSNIRGLDILACLDFLHARGGPELMGRVMANLSEADIETLAQRDAGSGRLPAMKWYPFALHCRLLHGVQRELGPHEPDVLFTMGRHMARRDLPRVFRSVMRLGSPSWPLRLMGRMWRLYHDHGMWDLRAGPNEVVGVLRDRPESNRLFCRVFTGWGTEALELTGAQDAHVHHTECRGNLGETCTFVGRWRDP